MIILKEYAELSCLIIWVIFLVSVVKESSAAEIRRLFVPRWIRNGSKEAVVLDCDYVYNENDLRLVVKWFFEDNSEPVYQWIPDLNIKYTSGVLKNRLDLNFSVNTVDPYSKYRALRILKPSIELSGKYRCLVTSLAGQDSKEQVMTVFAPAQDFEFHYSIINEDAVNVSCEVWGVYPFPQLKLILHTSSGNSPQSVNSSIYLNVLKPTGAYDVLMHRLFSLVELTSKGVSVFECLLHLPGTNYMQSKRIAFFPDAEGQDIGSLKELTTSASQIVNNNLICVKLSLFLAFSYFTSMMNQA